MFWKKKTKQTKQKVNMTRLRFLAHSLYFREREGLEMELMIYNAYMMASSLKSQKVWGFEEHVLNNLPMSRG